MPKTLLSKKLLLSFLLWSALYWGWAQDAPTPSSLNIIAYIQQLERDFDVKFSYVDEDLRPLEIKVPKSGVLEEILEDIRNQTQLQVKKLSERYYTLSKSITVDICARILDNFEQNNVTGASVEVLGSSIATITDLDGNFMLTNIPRKASIRIRHLGYKTKYVTAENLVSKNPCQTVLLGLNYQQLDEVVVYKFLTTGLVKQSDGSIELNTAEFGILPGLIEPDVLQTVQALPGIKSIDETVSDINIRGGTNDQNLLLWDGIKMYQSGHFFGLISAFNPYLTDKIRIIKNGTSAEYGDGVSGIIDMRTQNEIADQVFGGAGFNLISGDLYAHIPLSQKLGVQFSARRSATDFFTTPTYDEFIFRAFQNTEIKVDNSQNSDVRIDTDERFYFYDFTGKILYDYNEDHKVRVSFININNLLDYTETAENTGRTNQSNLDQTNLSLGGSLESRWTDRFSTNLSGYYTFYSLDAQNITANGVQGLLQKNTVKETSAKLNTVFVLNDNLSFGNGYELTEVGITNETRVTQPPFESELTDVIRKHSAFSEVNYISENERLRAQIGGRFNYIENIATFSDIVIEPRLNASYLLTDHLRVELLGEFKNQTTNQVIDLEQNFLGIEKRRWVLSNTKSDTLVNGRPGERALPIVTSKQGSIGFHYDRGYWYFGLEGFYKVVDNISTATQGFQNQDQFNGEIGMYEVKGVEFLLNYKTEDFSSWVSYTYNVNDYTFDDIVPPMFPNNLDVRHTATVAANYTYNDFKFGIGLNYRTGRPFTEPLDDPNSLDTTVFPNRINYQDPNSSRLPDYVRLDASAIYKFNISPRIKATAGASILNILDRENILNTYYRLNDQNEIERIENKSLGLTPNISFRVSF
ncbi:TonB-dependent receptor [Poritiphilus flavus]|uniref:TonB-dependent receptor plug domain-containing protein n=1 Tax=Poritiphilus flavus TaxID=2697053 RepID=A0A6L9EJ97_9FLAO|nr:carboxypeptidase-like regulatory domain-containing protein [Poritiphilus flavus]NAS14249.1 TonB-dependent receptor plug domain-containing protein [Poritiphilus flavus]